MIYYRPLNNNNDNDNDNDNDEQKNFKRNKLSKNFQEIILSTYTCSFST